MCRIRSYPDPATSSAYCVAYAAVEWHPGDCRWIRARRLYIMSVGRICTTPDDDNAIMYDTLGYKCAYVIINHDCVISVFDTVVRNVRIFFLKNVCNRVFMNTVNKQPMGLWRAAGWDAAWERECAGYVLIASLRAAVMICATLVNTQTHIHTAVQLLTCCNRLS